MKPSEYLDPKRFPLTTQPGLDLKGQMMIDAFNHDELKAFLERGGTPDAEQTRLMKELEAKVKAQAEVKA